MDIKTCPGCGAEFDPTQGHECEQLKALRYAAWEKVRQSGQYLSREESIEFLERNIWLGHPRRVPRGRRGPQSKRTQYDEFADCRREPLRRLKKLPAQSDRAAQAAAKVRRKIGDRTREHIRQCAQGFVPYGRAKGRARNFAHLVRLVSKKSHHDPKTVRTVLKSAKYR